MVNKNKDDRSRSRLIKRVLCFCGALVVAALCLAPAVIPADAYTDGPIPNLTVYLPLTVSFCDSQMNYLTMPMTSKYSVYTSSPGSALVREGNSGFSVHMDTLFGANMLQTAFDLDCDPLLPSFVMFNNNSPVILNDTKELRDLDLFGFVPADGSYEIIVDVGFRAQIMRSVEADDGSLVSEFDWVALTIQFDEQLQEEYWGFSYDDLDVYFGHDYEDGWEATGLVVLDTFRCVAMYVNSDRETFSFRVTQGSSSDTQLMTNLLCQYTSFGGYVTLPDVPPPAGGGDLGNVDFVQWLTVAVGGFLDFELSPGISLGGVLAVIVGIGITIVFIKLFGG